MSTETIRLVSCEKEKVDVFIHCIITLSEVMQLQIFWLLTIGMLWTAHGLLQHWCLQFAVDQYVKVKWLLGWWLLFPPFFSLRLPLAGLVGLRDGYKSAVTDLFNLWPSWWRWLITSELENTSNKNTTLLTGWKRECNMLICLFVFRVSILYKYVYYCCCPDHYKNCLS